jgi:RimJ/RimL family protein N-acetyltransferase
VQRDARGRGVATRAVLLIARWAIRDCGLRRLQLRADIANAASQRVAEKAGFKREGVLRSVRYSERQGRRVDFAVFSLLPDELPSPGN